MAELRWNPIDRRYVMVAGHRQHRPQMPTDWCPFCPGSGKVPDKYTVHVYPNDFPALSIPAPEPSVGASDPYGVAPAAGCCEVLLYTSDHNGCVALLDDRHLQALFAMWKEQYIEVGGRPEVKHVLTFENRGDVIGVTMPHPHGQLYGFPYIPPRFEHELESADQYYQKNNRNLFADVLKAEKAERSRIVLDCNGWTAFVPFCADYPFEVHIYPEFEAASIADVDDRQGMDLLRTIRQINRIYDSLYDFPLPFMMALHQSPTDGVDRRNTYRFHVKFYPLHRSATNIKFCATCETDAFAHCNPTYPEEKAADLRQALQRGNEKYGADLRTE